MILKWMKRARHYSKIAFITFFLTLISACGQNNSVSLPGYIEGRYTYIACNYSGVLKTLDVAKGQEVKAGQLLFTLVPEPEFDELIAAQDKVKQAIAQVETLQTEYDLQKKLLERRIELQKQKFVSQEELDLNRAKFNETSSNLVAQQNNLLSAKADLRKAEWAASQKIQYSPVTGLVFDTYFTPGELVDNNVAVLSLLNPDEVKVYFYSPEGLLGQLKLNQIVNVTCDNCKKPIQAKIVYISPSAEYAPPVIYSNEVRAKLVYRIEAKPLIKNAYYVLHPGQPITVHIDVKH